MDEKGINYVTASYELKEEDFEFEKKNIVQYTDKKDDYNLSLLHLLYPTFTYNREDIKIIDGKPPYGECFTTAFNEDGTLLACGYNNGHVNIFDLKHPKKPPVKFSPSTYPITSIKWNNKKKTTLLVGAADGYISHWHTSSGKNLNFSRMICPLYIVGVGIRQFNFMIPDRAKLLILYMGQKLSEILLICMDILWPRGLGVLISKFSYGILEL